MSTAVLRTVANSALGWCGLLLGAAFLVLSVGCSSEPSPGADEPARDESPRAESSRAAPQDSPRAAVRIVKLYWTENKALLGPDKRMLTVDVKNTLDEPVTLRLYAQNEDFAITERLIRERRIAGEKGSYVLGTELKFVGNREWTSPQLGKWVSTERNPEDAKQVPGEAYLGGGQTRTFARFRDGNSDCTWRALVLDPARGRIDEKTLVDGEVGRTGDAAAAPRREPAAEAPDLRITQVLSEPLPPRDAGTREITRRKIVTRITNQGRAPCDLGFGSWVVSSSPPSEIDRMLEGQDPKFRRPYELGIEAGQPSKGQWHPPMGRVGHQCWTPVEPLEGAERNGWKVRIKPGGSCSFSCEVEDSWGKEEAYRVHLVNPTGTRVDEKTLEVNRRG